MGKRKAAAKKPTGPRKNEPLPTVFPCLFCNHEKSVMVKLDKKAGVGHLSCKVCNQQFQCAVNYLSAAVDVYSDWVDACDAVAKQDGEGRDVSLPVGRTSLAVAAGVSRNTSSKTRHEITKGNLDDLIDDGDISDGADDDDY